MIPTAFAGQPAAISLDKALPLCNPQHRATRSAQPRDIPNVRRTVKPKTGQIPFFIWAISPSVVATYPFRFFDVCNGKKWYNGFHQGPSSRSDIGN
jgi:hypothetical protein